LHSPFPIFNHFALRYTCTLRIRSIHTILRSHMKHVRYNRSARGQGKWDNPLIHTVTISVRNHWYWTAWMLFYLPNITWTNRSTTLRSPPTPLLNGVPKCTSTIRGGNVLSDDIVEGPQSPNRKEKLLRIDQLSLPTYFGERQLLHIVEMFVRIWYQW